MILRSVEVCRLLSHLICCQYSLARSLIVVLEHTRRVYVHGIRQSTPFIYNPHRRRISAAAIFQEKTFLTYHHLRALIIFSLSIMAARDDRDSHNGSSQSGSGTELGIEPVADKTFNEQDVDPAAETTGKAKQASADVEPASEKINQQVAEEKTYSTWSNSQKRFLVFMSSGAAFFSPLAANIYYPVFNILADYLHVSNTLINVTVTSYMVSARHRPA